MTYSRTQLIIKKLACEKCTGRNYLVREKSKNKSRGHSENLYCVRCKTDTRHIETGS